MSENLIGATTAVFPIRLSVAIASPVNVEWATRDGSAVAGSDYKAAAGTVTFLPGETEKQIEVQVYGQAITPADDKVFFIRLNPPSNAVLVDAIITCTINVIDDQGIPSVAVVVAEGLRGSKGDPGLSAYEQAVVMGYTGTLIEWMDHIADASKAADRAGDHAISASEDALKAQNAAKNAVFAGVIFPTAAEGVDPVLGVQNSAYFNVRSPLSEHYIDEYQNVNGVAVATGKSYPTSDHLQNISDHTALPFVNGKAYELHHRVQLDSGDIVKSTVANNIVDPNEMEVIKPNTYGWFNETLASKNLYETQARLLDFIPRQYHSEIFSGNSTRDFSSYINYAVNEIRGDLIFPHGVITSAEPLLLNRGIRFLGNGPFDTAARGSSTIKLLDGSNCPLIQTPRAQGGESTHYMAVENIRLDGNAANQTEFANLFEFHGAWIGSWLRNFFIINAYGTALDLDKGADIEIDHLWINSTVTGDERYAFNSNSSYVGTETNQGMLNGNHIYVENTAIERYTSANSPRTTPSNRGNAINLQRFTTVNLNEVHLEGCRRMIDIDNGQTHRFGKISAAHVGLASLEDQAIVRLKSSGIASVHVGTAVVTTKGDGTIYGVKKATGVTTSYPNAALSGSPATLIGYDFKSGTNPIVKQASAFVGSVDAIKNGSALPKLKLHNSDDLNVTSNDYSGMRYSATGAEFFTTRNQSGSEKVFFRINASTSPLSDHVEFLEPILIGLRTVNNNLAAGALLRYQNATVGDSIAYSLRANIANHLATVLTDTTAPKSTPNHIGQIFVDRTSKECYIATGIASAADWTLLN